jgi:transcriptional regulator with XRE-family HTH domain
LSRKKRNETMKNDPVSERVKRLRLERHMSQAEFAKAIQVTQPMVSAWEAGKEGETPSLGAYMRLGNLAGYPDNVWFWQQAGLEENRMLSAAERVLEERGAALILGETLPIRCFSKTSEGISLLDRPFVIPAKFAPNPLSTLCLIVDESAATPKIPAGTHIVLDESGKDASLSVFRNRVVLTELSIPVRYLKETRSFAKKFGGLHMGRLQFKPSGPLEPNAEGIFALAWCAILDPSEGSFTWRIGDPGLCIGSWTYIGKAPESEKDEQLSQDDASRRALRELRLYDKVQLLGEVRGYFWPPAINGKG